MKNSQYRYDTEKIVEDLVDLAISRFNDSIALEQINKFNFSQEDKLKIWLGLRMVGLTLFSDYGFYLVIKNYPYTEEDINVLRYMILDASIETFTKKAIAEGILKKTIDNWHTQFLKLIYDDIAEGINNPTKIWGENEQGGLILGGILGVVIRRVFQVQGIGAIVNYDTITLFKVSTYFDEIYTSSMLSLHQDIGQIIKTNS